MSADVSVSDAMLLWNSGLHGETPACIVRPVGHDDYYQYQGQVGACMADYQALDAKGQQLQLLVEAWHIANFDGVPIEMVHQALLVVPAYRAMLADDCLPKQFRHERF